MVVPLPLFKLGAVAARSITRPLAKEIKVRSKQHPSLTQLCRFLGQAQHRLAVRVHMGYKGVTNFTIKDLADEQAVEAGADLAGDIMIFAVAVTVATMEYTRATLKQREKDRSEAQAKKQAEEALERRFEGLEEKMIWLETQLARLGRLVEAETDMRMQLAMEQAKIEAEKQDQAQVQAPTAAAVAAAPNALDPIIKSQHAID